jgi:hypothetical protein
MNKYVKGIIIGVVAGLAITIIATTKISINIQTNANSVQADTTKVNINSMTIDDANNYLNNVINDNSYDSSQVNTRLTKEAAIAQAIYQKKTYELLKEKLK